MDVNGHIRLAMESYNAGDLERAEALCRRVLEVQDDNAYATYFMGILYYKLGRYDRAIEFFDRTSELMPGSRDLYLNKGNAFKEIGHEEEALECYEKAIEFDPSCAEAYNNLGIVLQTRGYLDEAVINYRKALEISPNFIDAQYNLGTAFQDKKENAEAIRNYREALALSPDLIDAYYNIGVIFQEERQFDEAVTNYRKALTLDPGLVAAYNNMGTVLQEMGMMDEALECFELAVKQNPSFAQAHSNIGSIMKEKGQLDDAISHCRKAIEIDSDLADAYSNLGASLIEKGESNEAVDYLKKALELNPDLAMAHWNLSLALLLTGDFKAGWEEYEWRCRIDRFAPASFPESLWDGSDIKHKIILLHTEQGFGDAIQFVRYTSLIAERGARVMIACPKELALLFRNVQGVSEVIAQGDKLPHFDVHCPLLSLPRIFKTVVENIPVKIPYLAADAQLVENWRDKVGQDRARLKIGIVWAGAQIHKWNRYRSFSIKTFAPIFDIEEISFYSLQKEGSTIKSIDSPFKMNLKDYMDDISDFSDTAALIENLDLVISVDTAVAHLAGAMGKPVWTLLPFAPDWRWMLGREDSVWYPTMRLFRQRTTGDWSSVMKRVKKELETLLGDRSLI